MVARHMVAASILNLALVDPTGSAKPCMNGSAWLSDRLQIRPQARMRQQAPRVTTIMSLPARPLSFASSVRGSAAFSLDSGSVS